MITVIDERHGIRRTQAVETGQLVDASDPKASVLVYRTRENPPESFRYADSMQGIRQHNIHGGSSIRTKLLSPVSRNITDAT